MPSYEDKFNIAPKSKQGKAKKHGNHKSVSSTKSKGRQSRLTDSFSGKCG